MLCRYPHCRKTASKTFALIELCKSHHKAITEETDKFYKLSARHGKQASEHTIRKHYGKIAPMISWSKYNMRQIYLRG